MKKKWQNINNILRNIRKYGHTFCLLIIAQKNYQIKKTISLPESIHSLKPLNLNVTLLKPRSLKVLKELLQDKM